MGIIKPKVHDVEQVKNLEIELNKCIENYEIRDIKFENLEDENINAEKYEFRNCIFENCKYIKSNFENAYFSDVIWC